MVDKAVGKGVDLLKIDTSVADDNVGAMKVEGSTVYFYMSKGEVFAKGGLLGPFRWATGNKVQRMSTIALYNTDDDTIKALDHAYKFKNNYMSLRTVRDVLGECGRKVRSVDREDNLRYDGEKFGKEVLGGIVGFKIWLD